MVVEDQGKGGERRPLSPQQGQEHCGRTRVVSRLPQFWEQRPGLWEVHVRKSVKCYQALPSFPSHYMWWYTVYPHTLFSFLPWKLALF